MRSTPAKLQSLTTLPTWRTASALDASSLPTKLAPDPVRNNLRRLRDRNFWAAVRCEGDSAEGSFLGRNVDSLLAVFFFLSNNPSR